MVQNLLNGFVVVNGIVQYNNGDKEVAIMVTTATRTRRPVTGQVAIVK